MFIPSFTSGLYLYSDVYKIQEGIGDKAGKLIQAFSTFITAFTIGFVKGWKLTLVILAVSPALGISAGIFSKVSFSPSSLCFSFKLHFVISPSFCLSLAVYRCIIRRQPPQVLLITLRLSPPFWTVAGDFHF